MLSFLGIAAVALVVVTSMAFQRLGGPGPLSADKVVYIESGTDTKGIVDELEREGVIDSWPLMTGALYIRGDRKKIKAGEYLFKQGASLSDVIDTLVSGQQILHSVTIPEGLTSEQIVERLKDDDILIGDVKAVPKEGTLMPDTFKFARGTKREAIIAKMQAEQKDVVAKVWAHRSPDTPIKSIYDLVTLASVVEKETGRADERPRVAGVFINRLTKNMPLQSDPTTVYGLVGGKGTLGRGILKSELEQKTPYNTYVITGLPPGPICNPGRAAMEAVANPSRTKDIYFVADGTGGHAFAETLDQHRQNVQRWRQIEKDAKDKAAPDADKLLQSSPPGTNSSKPNQRGDLAPSVPIYGALSGHFDPPQRIPAAALVMGSSAYPLAFAGDERVADRLQPVLDDHGFGGAPGADQANAEGGSEMGDGLPLAMSAEEQALAASEAKGSGMTFPVPASRRADEKAQAAQFGLSSGTGRLPPQGEMTNVETASSNPAARPPMGKGRVFDASEGTKLDPLLDKTYDLNSPKTVPLYKPLASR